MNISCPVNPLGLRSLNGQYTRKIDDLIKEE